MIFTPFVGVNHHNQTIVFGCGFLSDEKTESFIWLFEQWLKAMPSGPPQLIITDQDQAISKAIAQVFPLAFHHCCIWHIMDKFPQKLGPMLSVYMPQFSASVYGSETIEEYEESWKHALMQHSALENHEWLLQMYKLRKQWVPAFCMHIFSAGMSSSQRVESGHSFKKYVSKRNSLWDFVTRFERALGHQRHKEVVSDHVDVNEMPKLKTLFPIEKQMRGLYTKTTFLKFQDEVFQSTAYLKCDATREDEKECVYVVMRADVKSSTLRHIVHDKVSNFARCSCQKFEFEGIPCRHIVFFLRSIHIVDLPSQYIMKRWTKSVKAERVWDGDGLEIKDVQYKSLTMRHIQLSQLSQCLIDESSLMEETTELVRKGIESLPIEVKGLRSSLGVREVPTKRKLQKHMINEPAQVKAKGSGKRMKSSKEKAMGKAKKYKASGGFGHTIKQCPMSEDGSSIHNAEASHDRTCVPNETPHIVGMHDH